MSLYTPEELAENAKIAARISADIEAMRKKVIVTEEPEGDDMFARTPTDAYCQVSVCINIVHNEIRRSHKMGTHMPCAHDTMMDVLVRLMDAKRQMQDQEPS